MPLLPEADVVAVARERLDGAVLEAGLEVDDLARRVEPRPVDGLLRREALVQDPREHLRERRPEPGAPGGAGGEHEPLAVERDGRRHHARHALAGIERPDEQVGLPEHAVQVDVVARKEVARAEPEAGREDASAPGRVDGAEVGRVLVGSPAVERCCEQAREDEGAAGRRHAVQAGEGRQRVGELREPTARLDADAGVGHLGRLGPLDAVRGQVLGRDEAGALLHQLEQRLGERALVERAGALGGHDLQRGHEPRLVEPVAGLQQPPSRRVHAPALSHRHHRRQHGKAVRVGRRHVDPGSGEPQRRLHEPVPGERPAMPPQLVQARGHAGNGARRGADEVVHQLLSEGHGQLLELGRLAPLSEPRDGHEEVQHLRLAAPGLDQNGVAAARDPRHHGLCHARGERRGHGRVDRRPALGEDLETGLGRRRMACRNAWRYLHLC